MKKLLRTIAVLALFLPGAWLAIRIGDFTGDRCQWVASEALCRPVSRGLMGLGLFFVAWFALTELKKLWPAHFKSKDD